MDYKDLENWGQQVNRWIHDAVDSFDFDKLNQEIRRNADDVISGVKNSFNDYSGARSKKKHRAGWRQDSFEDGYHKENWQTYRKIRPGWEAKSQGSRQWQQAAGDAQAHFERSKAPKPPKAARGFAVMDYGFPVERSPKGEVSGTLLTVFGALGFGLSACGWIALGITAVFSSWLVSVAALWGLTPFVLAFIVMMIVGTYQRNRVKRFRRYIASMKGKSFATFKNLASLTGKSVRYTIRDVSRMLKLGYFPQGHIDSHKTCLMVTDSIYQQYLNTMENARNLQQEDEAQVKKETRAGSGEPQEIQELEKLGRQYMDAVRKANDDIPDVEISNKLYRMEMIIGKIFEHIKKYPQKADRLFQFQNYYMPMTIKLLETYRDLDGQPIEGENIKKVKKEIEGTLDTINEAYEKLYDSMYQETAMDVSSDISVLRTLLAREGLTKGAFDKKEKQE